MHSGKRHGRGKEKEVTGKKKRRKKKKYTTGYQNLQIEKKKKAVSINTNYTSATKTWWWLENTPFLSTVFGQIGSIPFQFSPLFRVNSMYFHSSMLSIAPVILLGLGIKVERWPNTGERLQGSKTSISSLLTMLVGGRRELGKVTDSGKRGLVSTERGWLDPLVEGFKIHYQGPDSEGECADPRTHKPRPNIPLGCLLMEMAIAL